MIIFLENLFEHKGIMVSTTERQTLWVKMFHIYIYFCLRFEAFWLRTQQSHCWHAFIFVISSFWLKQKALFAWNTAWMSTKKSHFNNGDTKKRLIRMLSLSVHALNPKVIEHSCSSNAKMNIHLPHALLHTHTANTHKSNPRRKHSRQGIHILYVPTRIVIIIFRRKHDFSRLPGILVHVPKEIHHTHTHTPRQTTHKRPTLPRRRRRREFSCIFFSALLFTTRLGHTIIFIVFWVKFCVHDEGLWRPLSGASHYMYDGCAPHTQSRNSLFPSSPPHAGCLYISNSSISLSQTLMEE